MADLSSASWAWQKSPALFFLLSRCPGPGPGPSSRSPPDTPPPPPPPPLPLPPPPPLPPTPSSCSMCSPPPGSPLLSWQVHQETTSLHGNMKTAEKWQLNAAAPHLILTLALTEQIMGNNTPLCCGKMKCFSRRLSWWGDLFVTVPAQISLYFPSFLLFLLSQGRIFFSHSLISFPIPFFCSFCFYTFSFCFPSLFSSLFESLMNICESYLCNNSNYLHNDLQVTKHF